MTDSTIPAHAGSTVCLRWIGVLGLVHPVKDGLRPASLPIARGEFAFLVGPTGCGKSTFIRLLMKEVEAARGKVLIAGTEIGELPRKKLPRLRRNIGVVFQDYKLLPNRTVYDNVAYC